MQKVMIEKSAAKKKYLDACGVKNKETHRNGAVGVFEIPIMGRGSKKGAMIGWLKSDFL